MTDDADVVIVTGARRLHDDDRPWVTSVIQYYAGNAEVFVGDAAGVDALTRATINPYRLQVVVADWRTLGKAAGPVRNEEMVALAVAWAQKLGQDAGDILGLAFPGPASRGTWDCTRRMVAAGIPVIMRGLSR